MVLLAGIGKEIKRGEDAFSPLGLYTGCWCSNAAIAGWEVGQGGGCELDYNLIVMCFIPRSVPASDTEPERLPGSIRSSYRSNRSIGDENLNPFVDRFAIGLLFVTDFGIVW